VRHRGASLSDFLSSVNGAGTAPCHISGFEFVSVTTGAESPSGGTMNSTCFKTAWLESGAHDEAPDTRRVPARRLDVAIERRTLRAAHLIFARGAPHVTLGACELDEHLLVASFFRRLPEVAAERAGTIVVRYPRTSILDYRAFSAEISLAAGVDWWLQARGGQRDAAIDLRAATLARLELSGGQFDVTLKLPRPDGVVPLALEGGAFDVNVLHPAGIAVDVRIAGGVDDCAFDGRRIEALDADFSAGDAGARPNRYVLSVIGGARRLSVTSW
jgi:hypothetical protein